MQNAVPSLQNSSVPDQSSNRQPGQPIRTGKANKRKQTRQRARWSATAQNSTPIVPRTYSQIRNGPLPGSRDASMTDDSDRLHSRHATNTHPNPSIALAAKKPPLRVASLRFRCASAARTCFIRGPKSAHSSTLDNNSATPNPNKGVNIVVRHDEYRSCPCRK